MSRSPTGRRSKLRGEASTSSGERVRRRRSPEQARALILDAAQRLLAAHGPDAIGLKDVAREAGVSHALVSHYFGTVEALIESVFREQMLRTRAEIIQEIGDLTRSGPAEWIQLSFDHLAHPLTGRLLAWAILTGRLDSEDFFPRREQGMRFVADAIEARLRAQLGADRVPPREDLEFAMLLVFSATLGYVVARNVLWASLSREPAPERDRWFREKLAAHILESMPAARALHERQKHEEGACTVQARSRGCRAGDPPATTAARRRGRDRFDGHR
jgi:AcrR family transcriptional regulator